MKKHAAYMFILCFLMAISRLFGAGANAAMSEDSSNNRIEDLYTSCRLQNLTVTIKTSKAFRGAIYAKGYPDKCQVSGRGMKETRLVLSPDECGVKVIEENGIHMFELLIYVQFDPSVQQVTDEQLYVTCSLKELNNLSLTGRSSVVLEKEKENSSASNRKEKKKNRFVNFYPPSISKIPSKLQQMVRNHFQKSPSKAFSQSSTTTSKPTSTVAQPPPTLVSSADVSSTLTPSSMPHYIHLTSKQSPLLTQSSQVISSGVTITSSGKAVEYNGIFKASPQILTKSSFEPKYQASFEEEEDWKPILLPDPIHTVEPINNDQEIKLRSLLEEENKDKVSCWLDIIKGNSPFGESTKDELIVGETAQLVIRVRKQEGLDTKVTSCKAHDGSGENGQILIDKDGCSVDEEIMPTLQRKSIISSDEILFFSPFKVFKFPDHDSLHLKCSVLICMGECETNCARSRKPRQASGFFILDQEGRIFSQDVEKPSLRDVPPQKPTKQSQKTSKQTPTLESQTSKVGIVVDIIEVFNSVNVRAPGIDHQPVIFKDFQVDKTSLPTKRSEDEVFCLTSTKLLVTFGILLAILFTSLLCALYWCVKDRSRKEKLQRNLSCQRTPQTLRPINTFPHSRLHGVKDYSKFPQATPYRRFPH